MTPVEQTMISSGAAAETLGGFLHRFTEAAWPTARGAVGIARISDDGAHAALRSAQILLGNHHRRGDHKILREDGRG